MAAAKVIGTSVTRAEGPDKVTGYAIYAADVKLPGLLWGKILRSPHPHARIHRIETAKARQVVGVRAVVTGQEIPDRLMGKLIRDMPVLCWEVVRFIGDRVAAVAADTPEAADEALELISVEYEELQPVFDPLEAMQPSAPRIHENVAGYDGAPKNRLALDVPNGLTRLAWRKGDVEQGFREADLVLEHTFRIPGRHQGYIEPHAGVVAIEPNGKIQVWASTKHPFGNRSQMAKTLDMPEDGICFNAVNLGGEFGGKGDASDVAVAYFLALQAGRPVKIVMTSAEELTAGNPAHPTVVTVKTGVKRDGRIVARYLQAVHASGAYGALKPNATLSTWNYIGGPYRVEHASFEFLQIYTNTVPGGYFRGPGGLATYFALESHTDIIAQELGMDPAEFRLKNLIGEGEEDATGQRLRSVRFREVLQAALDAAQWKRFKPGLNRGRGIALFGRHTGAGESGVVLTAEPSGTFTVISPTFDQGAGTHTILQQLVAEEMRVPVQQVRVMAGSTDIAPYDSGARSSRVTYVASHAVVEACGQLRANLMSQAVHLLECQPEEVDFQKGKYWLHQDPSQQVNLRQLIARAKGPLSVTVQENLPQPEDVTYFCAQVAEVEVNKETGEIRVHRFVTAHDVGTIINPIMHQGQIEGGVVMGMGQALMEELVMERGQVMNGNPGDYKLPTVADIPKLKTVLVHSGGGIAPYEAKAIGELSNNSPPAAIANAVANGIGVRLFELPITAEKIYRALSGETK